MHRHAANCASVLVYSTDSHALVILVTSAVACFQQVGCDSNAAGLGCITFTRHKVYKQHLRLVTYALQNSLLDYAVHVQSLPCPWPFEA